MGESSRATTGDALPRDARDEGATAVEYGIMIALIAAVIIGVVLVIGNQVQEGFCNTATDLADADGVTTGPPGDC